MIHPPEIEKDRNKMSERIINLTLEIIYLLTGEDYTIVKKSPDKHVAPGILPCVSGGWSRTQDTIMSPPSEPLIQERSNAQKIIQLTNKIIELLTGEVPIRCQDVTVYLSMEEWEYLEGHKDQYKDVMMEDQQPLTPHEYSGSNIPESRHSPPYCQNDPEEMRRVLQDDQGEDLTDIKEEVIVEEKELNMTSEGKIPTDVSTADYPYTNNIDEAEFRDTSGEHPCPPHVPLVLNRALTSNLEEASSKQSPKIYIFQCSECGKCFKRNFNLMIHKRTHKNERPFSCSKCGKCFTRKSNLANHKRIHAVKNPYSCTECGRCFTKKSNFAKHEKSHTGEKRFSCPDCGRGFIHKQNLKKHKRIHIGDKPFSCSECEKCFTRKEYLESHQKIHTGEKPYICLECGKCFTHKQYLKSHEKVHTGVKPYPCSECEKCYSHKSDLLRHQKVHTGKRPFSCSECGKCFTLSSVLIEHQRIHTGEKPYSCSECDKCFTQQSHLITHKKIHTGKRPFSCSECGKCFALRSVLIEHQRIHTGEKPYSRLNHGKNFAPKSHLVKHLKTDTQNASLT